MKKNIKIIFYLFSPLFLLLSLNNSNIFASDISSTDYAREICGNAKFNKKSSFFRSKKSDFFSECAILKNWFFCECLPVLVGST